MARERSRALRQRALQTIEAKGGIVRTKQAIAAGIHPRILYELRDAGKIQQLAPGLFCLHDYSCVQDPDLLVVSRKVPEGVICLISALYLHGLTVQIPRRIDVAIPQKSKAPVLDYPPVQFYWFSESSYRARIHSKQIDGGDIKIYSKEKTIVDCFRFRNRIGIEIAIEALRTYWEQDGTDVSELRSLARKLRVLRTMDPYLESIVHDQS